MSAVVHRQVPPGSGQAADSDEPDFDDEPEVDAELGEPDSEPVDVLEDVLDVVEEPAPLPDRLSVR